jgi:hypothetical protein
MDSADKERCKKEIVGTWYSHFIESVFYLYFGTKTLSLMKDEERKRNDEDEDDSDQEEISKSSY